MKKTTVFLWKWKIIGLQKVLRTMKLTIFLLLDFVANVFANKTDSQTKRLNLSVKNSFIKEMFQQIEEQKEACFI